ncbi:MAG: histidinol-phosphate transaminase [Rhodothermales bacterium]
MNRRQWLCRAGLASTAAALPRWSGGTTPRPSSPYTIGTRIRLRGNENPYGPSPAALDAMAAVRTAGNRYAVQPASALEAHITEREGLTPDHVLLTHGSFEVLGLVAQVYVRPGTEVIKPDPTFGVLGDHAEVLGATVHRVPLTTTHAHDLGAMEERLNGQTSVVYVCNPNNPTGTLIDADTLRAFCKRVQPQALVLVDEAYHEYVDDPSYASMVALVHDRQRVLVSRTFSKLYGLAGLRVGYVLGRPDLIAPLRELRAGPISSTGIAAATASLTDHAFIAESLRRNAAARAAFYTTLDDLRLPYVRSHANFVWVNLGQPYRIMQSYLNERHIEIAGHVENQWARITIGTDDEMAALAAALRTFEAP